MALRRSLLVLLPLLTTACMNNGIEWSELDFTRKRPNEADLVGNWTATEGTVRDMKDRGGYARADPKLILAADGTCTVTDMPDWWRGGSARLTGNTSRGRASGKSRNTTTS